VDLQLRKGAVYSTTTSILFRIAPCVYLGAAFLAFLFIPIADLEPLLSFHGDIILVAYLLALSRTALILAALDTGSSFEGMGAAREALYGALVEPALMMGMATLALFCGYSSFADIFSMARDLDMNLTVVLVLVAYVFVIIMFVEAGRVPVDDPRTHLELTMIHEVMCLDYSGIDMAMIHIAGWLKNSIFAIIAANAVSVAFCFHWWFAAPLAVLGTGIAIGIVESFRARNKLTRNTTFILTIVAMSALVLLTGFLLIQNIEI
jgi:formate hydrogenlyase subunit 4